MKINSQVLLASLLVASCTQTHNVSAQTDEQTVRVSLKADMVKSESELADFSGLVDEQDAIGDPPNSRRQNAMANRLAA